MKKHLSMQWAFLVVVVLHCGMLAAQSPSAQDGDVDAAPDRIGAWAWMAHALIEPSENERYGLQTAVTRRVWVSPSGVYALHAGLGGDAYVQDERIFEVVKGHTRVFMPAAVVDQRFAFALWEQPLALALTAYAGAAFRTTDARVDDPVLGINRDINTQTSYFALGLWWQASVALNERLWLQAIVKTDLSRLVDADFPAVFNEQPGILFGVGVRQTW